MHAPALAGVDLEMRSINKTFSNASVIKGDNLSEKNVRRLLKNSYSVVHIATHSIINEKKPSLSGIIVGRRKDGNNINNDGFLSRSEINRLNISSNLVVLSACKTATGPVIGGEGMLGLQQAFFMAGVSSVIVSLWNVYDRATARLMKNFYHSLKINHNSWSETWDKFLRWIEQSDAAPFGEPAEAMHQAKLKLLHSPAYHDPVFWAPFIVIGR
jgi:CHAT domain-containing protein